MSGQTLLLNSEPKNICILRLSAIGDVCHAVSMVQSIQRQWPKVKITWVIGKLEALFLASLPNIEFIVFDKRKGFSGLLELKKTLAGRDFDVLLHMQAALRSSLVSWCIPAKVKLGFDRARAKEGQWLFSNARIKSQKHPHVLDGFAAFGEALGLEVQAPRWDMGISAEDDRWALEQVASSAPFVVISPAASKAERNWSVEGYTAIAEYLHGKGYGIVLTGGPTDMERELSQSIIQSCSFPILDLVGKTTLQQLLAVIRQAHLVIAPDTGPTHMAVVVGTPVVGLYAHSNPRRTGPYCYLDYVVNEYDAIIEEQKGKPWQELPWGVRAKGGDLMERITLDAVTEKVDAVLRDFYSHS